MNDREKMCKCKGKVRRKQREGEVYVQRRRMYTKGKDDVYEGEGRTRGTGLKRGMFTKEVKGGYTNHEFRKQQL